MKNQVKKSLSLIMAVLMLMSCWVWVAPEKANAYLDVSYSVTIKYDVENQAPNGGHVYIYYYPFNDDGTLSSTRTQFDDKNSEVSGGFFKEENGTYNQSKTATNIPGWPCEILWHVNSKGADDYKVRVTAIEINGVTVAQSSQWVDDGGTADKSNSVTWKWDGTGSNDSMVSIRNWAKPTFTTLTSISAEEAGTLGKLSNGNPITTTGKITGGKDQYGVDLKENYFPTSGVSYSLQYNDATGARVNLPTNITYASTSGQGKTVTVTLNDDLQKLFPGVGTGTLYLIAKYGSSSAEANIKFSNPEYTMTFNANGGKLIDGNSTVDTYTIGGTDSKLYYDTVISKIGKPPVSGIKAGKEFMGYYDKVNSDATGITANFQGTKYEDGVTKVTDTGDKTWYAAWQSSPINATFVTQDGQLIGTITGRYDNSMIATNMYTTEKALNTEIKSAYDNRTDAKTAISFDSNNAPIYKDGSTTYTFAGWRIIKAYDNSVVDGDTSTVLQGDVTFQATYRKADAATYTVSFKNTDGSVLTTKSGYNYRDQVTNVPATEPVKAQDSVYSYKFVGWAKDIGKAFYTVDSENKDENGATVVYTHKDGAEFVVKGDASYVPVFEMIPREYKVTYNYTEDNSTPASTVIEGYNWHDAVKAPEIKDNYTADGFRYYLTGWTVGNDATVKQLSDIKVEGDMVLNAVYGDYDAAKYTINFYGKDEDGETDVLLNAESYIYEHNSAVAAPAVPQTIDTADALYTFAGWSPEVNTTASGDVDYYATYTKKAYADIHYYNYDGTLIYELDGKENSLFEGEVIPAFNGETPVKAEDVVGSYSFIGWQDGEGNVVVPGTDKFTGDTYLTAQFETEYKDYTVEFLNDVVDADGNNVVVSTGTYHYGDPITVPANPTKDADVEYIYDFRAWTPEVSEVCYGNATYTATYRRAPQYYAVTWLNDAKAVHTESNYQYNAKIQQAVINAPVSYPDPATGKTWAFKHWVQCDANGNDILVDGEQVIFIRGQRMGAEHLYFYPVFEEVDNILTVKFYKEDGTTFLGEAAIPYGANIADYAEPFAEKAPKAADETNHYVINNWVNVTNGATVSTITADVSVKATYTAEAHTKDIYDIILKPTCTETGLANVSCSATECGKTFYNVVLDVIPDEGAPTGQIYVDTSKWTLADYNAGIDYNEVKYVSPNTNVIVNAEDLGSRSKQNPDGILSRGVGKIDYYISETEVADPSAIGTWTNVYDYEATADQVLREVLEEKGKTMQDYIAMSTPNNKEKKTIDDEVKAILATYNANATGILSNLNLVNGKNYILYIRVSDREVNGQSNMCYFSSGTISYGSKAATITVSGDGYGTKFCADATIKVVDDFDGFTVYLDDEAITLDENGTYKCETKGVHTVTVVDKHGNKTMKTFEIKGAHSYRNYTVAASCENAGSRYDLCTVCGAKANEEVLPATGHSYTTNFVDKAPTCVVDGYRTYVCDNNCGTKLVLKPTDDAATLAQAKKFVEGAEGEEGTWVALTADDLKSLKATGTHTYAKVKDENGEDTAEDAWVIDKEATCSVPGSKHKDCIVCGIADARVTEEIPVDTVNGHKFYREKVTLEPTCTEKGKKTKTCRYCGYVELVEEIDALGHTEGEYRIITAATCEAVGSKILTCAVCGTDMGEAVEIPALGHAWKISGEIYLNEEDGKYYQDYICRNDATHKKSEEVEDYQPPVAATVTFDFGANGGYYIIPAVGNENEFGYVPPMMKGTQQVSAYVGEFIAADEVETALKQNNATKTYTFSHWADAEGNEVKFPVEVKGDATYYAVFTEKYINYTITYYKEDGTTEFKKTGYLHNGDKVALADGPAKAETNLVKYEFAGWVVIGSDPEVVYTTEATVNGANINLKAKYNTVKKQYAVTYAYSKNDILETFAVVAGEEARACAIVPVKANDSKYHYEFKAWNKAEQLKSVESNIYTTPDFEAVSHEYTVTVKSAATCTANRVDTYTCACGYSYDKEAANTALSHNWGEPVYDEATGKNTITCQNENCGVTETDTRTFTVKFFVTTGENAQPIKNINYIPWGTTIDAARLPATPVKESTATTDYTFKGWAVEGTTDIIDFTKFAIKQDYTLVAVFEGTARIYSVVFAYDAHNVIKTIANVEAGSDLTVTFNETPVKAFDATYHYTFSGWSGYEEGKLDITIEDVQADLYILAEFSKAKHEYTTSTLGEATCTNGSGTRYTCACGKYYDVAGKPLPHNYIETERKEATPHSDGYVRYKCETCTATKEEILKYNDNTMEIKVYVEHNGAPEAGVKVEIYNVDGSLTVATTNANGYANFVVDQDGAYTCLVFGQQVTLAREGDGYVGFYSYTDQASCSCACHRDNIWGAIFRFFHKIIKLFTGEFKCCENPDPMYG